MEQVGLFIDRNMYSQALGTLEPNPVVIHVENQDSSL